MSSSRDIPTDHPEYPPVQAILTALEERFGQPPTVAIVLGSGLGAVTDAMKDVERAGYTELNMPDSTVVGHAGVAVLGTLGGQRVLALSGRVHLYEGHPPAVLVRTVRALHLWGVGHLMLTNSAGSVHRKWPPGTLVRVEDHINFMGVNPLVGPRWGTRFPDPAAAYGGRLGTQLAASAAALEVTLPHGVYAAMSGPAYETAAEIRMVRTVGGDLVGMSTVPEVLACLEVGMDVAAIAVVSNYATGVSDEAVDHDSVTRVAGLAAADLARIFEHAVEALLQ